MSWSWRVLLPSHQEHRMQFLDWPLDGGNFPSKVLTSRRLHFSAIAFFTDKAQNWWGGETTRVLVFFVCWWLSQRHHGLLTYAISFSFNPVILHRFVSQPKISLAALGAAITPSCPTEIFECMLCSRCRAQLSQHAFELPNWLMSVPLDSTCSSACAAPWDGGGGVVGGMNSKSESWGVHETPFTAVI